MAEDLDLTKICHYLKKTLNCCGGNVLKDETHCEVIRLIFRFLLKLC